MGIGAIYRSMDEEYREMVPEGILAGSEPSKVTRVCLARFVRPLLRHADANFNQTCISSIGVSTMPLTANILCQVSTLR